LEIPGAPQTTQVLRALAALAEVRSGELTAELDQLCAPKLASYLTMVEAALGWLILVLEAANGTYREQVVSDDALEMLDRALISLDGARDATYTAAYVLGDGA